MHDSVVLLPHVQILYGYYSLQTSLEYASPAPCTTSSMFGTFTLCPSSFGPQLCPLQYGTSVIVSVLFIVQLWTCSIEIVWRATARHGAILHCSYCTVHVYTCFTSKRLSCMYRQDTYKVLHMIVRSCCRINTLFT